MDSFDEKKEMTREVPNRVELRIPVDEQSEEGLEAVVITMTGNIPSIAFDRTRHLHAVHAAPDIGIYAVRRALTAGQQVLASKPGHIAFRAEQTVSIDSILPGHRIGHIPYAQDL